MTTATLRPLEDGSRSELARLCRQAERQQAHAARRAIVWAAAHLILGLAGAALGAVAATTGLASESLRVPAAVLALSAAVVTAVLTFLRPEARLAAAKKGRGGWATLESELHLAADIDDEEKLNRKLRALLPVRQQLLANDYDQTPLVSLPPTRP